jgi:rod shape-determining protein MreC
MTSRWEKRHVLLIFIGLLCAQMLMMSVQARHPETGQLALRGWAMFVFSPVLSAVGSFATAVKDVWTNYAELRHARQEAEALRVENARLKQERHQLQEAARLGERVQKLVEFQQQLQTETLIARVIGRDVTVWYQTIIINRGQRDGVKRNSVVMTLTGLVGRAIDLAPYSAKVQLITDERSGAGAIIGVLGQSRALGVIEGQNEALCKMRYVPGSVPVQPGEWVFTTGQDRIYPRGIPIGRVASVKKGTAMVSHDITVELSAELSKLEEVIVLLDHPDVIEVKLDTGTGPSAP